MFQYHYKAILFRKWITMKRSWKSTVTSLVGTLVASALAILLNYFFVIFLSPKAETISFNDFPSNTQDLLFIDYSKDFPDSSFIQNYLIDMYKNETGREIRSQTFDSADSLKEWVINHQRSYAEPESIPFGVGYSIIYNNVNNESIPGYFIKSFFNISAWDKISDELQVEVLTTKALQKYIYDDLSAEINVSFITLNSRRLEFLTALAGPILIGCGLLSIVPMIITQPITDLTGEVRSYMESNSLTIFPYWLATFSIDIIIWVALTTLMWCIYLAAQIKSFHDNMFMSWYLVVAAGPSFIIFIYCVSFVFESPSSANRQVFLIFTLSMLVPFIIEMIRNDTNPIWLEWIFSLIPHLAIQRLYSLILQNLGPLKQNFSYYWTESKNTQPFLIMEIINILLYSSVLTIIEHFRKGVQNSSAKRSFNNYDEIFREIKAKNDITPEALQMEEEVKNSHDYAVRIENASRLFFNTEGKPIPAVNCVSLGVKTGSLFGFLGANGAGKTTLIRMITSMLPPSGVIEVFGKNITEITEPNIISVCPQFNKHLINEMTIEEHFKLYGMLLKYDTNQIAEKSEVLIKSLELLEIKDKPLNELSQGDVRKLAIALSFYSPAKIILLDEPTASLDPVARHNVQEMILENRGDKTFMLCTHLLSEAEFLCDMISIMVKGCVFTCGSPQLLTEKFGTDYKIDVMLKDESEKTEEKCNDFFKKMLPKAVCSISRPKARIFDIPASAIDLADLFVIMEEGKEGDNGYTYFTCSSSSLERVFMEIVRMSEEAEEI